VNFEVLATGVYLEGLAAEEDSVWISDPIKGGLRHLRPDGSARTWLPERLWIGSILFNGDHVILFSGEGGISWLNGRSGASGCLLDRVEGLPLLGVNEMITDADGAIYFGTLDVPAIATGAVPGPASLYRLEADGRVTRLRSGLKFCNGIGISADGKHLYFNETFVGTSVFDILPDGTLSEPSFLLDKPDCDGMAIDVEGTVWITGYQSSDIIGLRPDGSEKARIQTPAGGVTNIWFGGPDRRDLYLTGVDREAGESIRAGDMPVGEGASLYRTRVDVPGLKIPHARVSIPGS
jgi:sugar lactone lactonase YvrE